MKNLKSTILIAIAAIAMMATSCVKEQTAFNLEDIPYSATIIGRVTCNYGKQQNSLYQINDVVVPISNLNVFIKVSNSNYYQGLAGNTIFTATTNEDGVYEITIPCSLNGITATITTADFTGPFYQVKDNQNHNTPSVYSLKSAQTISSITPNSIKVCELIDFSHTPNPTVIK